MNGKAGVFSEDGGLISHRRCRLNSTFAIGGFSYSVEAFVITGSSEFQMKICARKPAHRKSAKRWQQW